MYNNMYNVPTVYTFEFKFVDESILMFIDDK